MGFFSNLFGGNVSIEEFDNHGKKWSMLEERLRQIKKWPIMLKMGPC